MPRNDRTDRRAAARSEPDPDESVAPSDPWEEASMRTMRMAGLALATMAALGASGVLAQDARCPDNDDKVVRIDIAVDREARTATVSPVEAMIYIGGEHRARRACWVVTGMADGDELQFVGKNAGCDDVFPLLKRVIRAAAPFANSGNPSKAGGWVYGVEVRDAAGTLIAEVDPVVVIKDDTPSGP